MKTIRFGIMISAALIAAMSFAAKKTKTAKMPAAANPVETKIEEWKREVKKLEAAPVAEGFVKWTGLDTIKGTKNVRWLGPSDLRGRFVVIVELDPAKVVEQFKVASSLQELGFVPEWDRDWEFSTIARDVMVVFNVNDLSDEDVDQQIYNSEDLQMLGIRYWCNFYGDVTFGGAPDSATERPYVYVMAPEGKEPIYKGKVVPVKTLSEAKAAIAKASAELPEWRPWYGYAAEIKHTKGLEATVVGGKALTPFVQALKKGIASRNPEIAAESQRLFDAIEQRKADLLWQIKKEWSQGPCAATYDIEELSKRFPAMKRELATYSASIAKAHPNIANVYKPYALYRRYTASDFQVKSTAEAKKLASALEKFKPTLMKFSDDAKDVAVQNVAASLLSRLDDVIAELPAKVAQP